MGADPFADEEQNSGGGFDPVNLLRTFWRRKVLFFVPFILCLSMAAVAIKTMTPIYASSGQVLIRFEGLNSELLTDPSQRYGRERNIDATAFHEMNMLMYSPAFLEKMVIELKLHESLRDAAAAIGQSPVSEEKAISKARSRLSGRLKLKQDGPRLFVLEVRDTDPEVAYNLASSILTRFVEEYRQSQTASSTSTKEFLIKQLSVYRRDLVNAETAMNEFQSGLASESLLDNPINALNLSAVLENLEGARQRFNGTDAREIADLSQDMRALLGSAPKIDKFLADDIVRATLHEMESVGLDMTLYAEGSRERSEYETRLFQLRVRLNNRIEEMVLVQYSNLSLLDRSQISNYIYFSIFRGGAERVIAELDQKIAEFRSFTARRPGQSSRITELQGDVVNARSLVSSIEAEITIHTLNLEASASEIGMQIRIRRSPEVGYAPVEPDKLKLTLMGIVLSLGIGLGLVVLAIFMDRSFHSIDDIERTLGLSVIGTLPVIQDNHFERKRKVRLMRWATIILGIIAVGAVGFLVIYPRIG
ncbi:MAG: hypothetical protein ACI9UK_002174 [Candidatus Krumholzibacteriia bacterium]|jgi:uncharacterized protein involved in exopolysaccharide biosynthesis